MRDSSRVIKGDSIHFYYTDSLFEKINILSNSKIITKRFTKSDSLGLLYPVTDTIQGQNINILFNSEEKIENFIVKGMAETKFNIIKNEIFKGKNNISGDTIDVKFDKNQMQSIDVKGGAQCSFIPQKDNIEIDSAVYYYGEHIYYDIDNEVSHLTENAKVVFGLTQLEAGEIIANWKNNILEANSYKEILPSVITSTNQTPMYGSSMIFNLATNQGKIIDGYSELKMGIFSGRGNQEIFQDSNEEVHIHHGIFTSCNAEIPHYYFYSDYMKSIPNDKIIVKPIQLYINSFPTLYFPFAILPNSNSERKSGWIMPSFGNRSVSGTYIDDLGYYWAPNEYMDIKTLIDFQDKRGLYVNSLLRYKKQSGNNWYNYHMHGSIFYEDKKILLDGIEDFNYLFNSDSTRTIKNIRIQHNQSFDPTQDLSINYNYKSEKDVYEFDLLKRLEQNLSSSFNYNKRWEKSSLNMSYNQNENLFIQQPDSLSQNPKFYKYNNGPNINYSINSIKLFGNGDSWYNKIYFNYNFNFNYGKNNYYKQNAYFINDSTLNWSNEDKVDYIGGGATNKFKFNFTNKINWISLIPSLTIYEDWIWQYSASSSNELLTPDLNDGYKRRLRWNFSINTSTSLYGVFPIQLGKINSIRHKLTPRIILSYAPNLNTYDEDNIDPFLLSSLGASSSGYTVATFSVSNMFQAKVLDENQVYNKIDLLSWDMSFSYNPNNNPESNNLSNLTSNLSFKKPNGGEYLSLNMRHSFYDNQRELLDFSKGKMPKLVYLNAQASTRLNIFGSEFGANEVVDSISSQSDSLLSINTYQPKLNNDIKWKTDYYINFGGGYTEQTDKWKINHLNIEARSTFHLTKKWLLTHAALFNFVDMKIQSQSIKFYRPLHCWDFTFTWWPSGYSKGFNLTISINSPNLQDLKITSSSTNRQFGY